MSLSIGIIGMPNVGKSTLFNALTDAEALIANYPFATIEPNTGIVPIPNPRLAKLAKIYKTEKIVPATVQFVDIAGLVKGASQGEGLGNQFLSHIRSANAICHVVRAFKDDNVTLAGSKDPKTDVEIINTELALADLQTIDNRLPRLEKEAHADPKLKPLYETLQKAKAHLEKATPLHRVKNLDLKQLSDLFLMTAKPIIYVFNLDEANLNDDGHKQQLADSVIPAKSLHLSAKLESELRGLDDTDRLELLKSYGQTESGLIQLIHAAYDALSLQSFMTGGEKEVRAWTIPQGSTAPQAAGIVHTDFAKGFIAAQVVNYDNLIAAGSIAAARSAGQVRTEGRDYVMKPGDVVEFKFNV